MSVSNYRYPAIWIGGVPQILVDLDGDFEESLPMAVNDSDVIVGDSDDNAVVWIDGAVYNLNTLVGGNLNLIGAVSINSAGDILAYSAGQYGEPLNSYILIPVPEPMVIWPMALGLLRRWRKDGSS